MNGLSKQKNFLLFRFSDLDNLKRDDYVFPCPYNYMFYCSHEKIVSFLRKNGMIEEIQGKIHLSNLIKHYPDFMMILFYTDSSEKSKEALVVLDSFHEKHPDVGLFRVNASKVKDIHPIYGIDSVPTLLTLRKGQPAEHILGIQSEDDYSRLLSGTKHVPKREGKGQRLKVMVYTSDSCPWCGRAKSYLRKNSIPFTEVNVSRNSSAAQDIFRRSGQMGTPQIDINGHIVVGFDQPKIDRFLGIKG